MKKIILTLLILISISAFSQSLNKKQIRKINDFGIQTDSHDLKNLKIQSDFIKILKLNKKKNSNKTFGIILGSTSILTSSLGIIFLSIKKEAGMSRDIGNMIGGATLGIGLTSGAFSIKLFNSSKKRKKERDKMIKLYQ